MSDFDRREFYTRFAAPAQAEAVIDGIVTSAEQRVIALLRPEPFGAEELYVLDKSGLG